MSMSAMGWLQSSFGLDITGEWNRLVHMTVGGLQYTCLRKTFRDTDITLCKMVIDDAFPRAEDGSIVIDRDGATFRHVLNFLRTGQLLLPDGFDEWDLLLSDASAYGMTALDAAISGHPRFQRRQFRRALPESVYLRFDYRASSGSHEEGKDAEQSGRQQQRHQPPGDASDDAADRATTTMLTAVAVHLVPALPMLSVNSDTGTLQHHGRGVGSIDEAVTILLSTYEMQIESWDRTAASSAVFLTKRQ